MTEKLRCWIEHTCPNCSESYPYYQKHECAMTEKTIRELEMADIRLVMLVGGFPHCKLHGAMDQVSKENYWRCIATYRLETSESGRLKFADNNCRAGCIYD